MNSPPSSEFTGTGRFEIRRRLGAGGMGVVYEAFDRERRQRVALKSSHKIDDAATLYRFKHEFRALADVVHPNLVRLEELIEADGRWFFTMELVEGVDFLRYVCPAAGPVGGGGPLQAEDETVTSTESYRCDPMPGPPRLRAALRQLAEGLGALHARGLLHRDIKPSNVLVTPRGRVVLLDFGLAADLEHLRDDQRTDDQIVGTYTYMSPEQAEGGPLSPASDWYSVGVMLYRALTGRLPFQGGGSEVMTLKVRTDPPPPAAVAAGLPEDLAALCDDLLRRRPEDRPTGPEVLRRLGAPAAPMAGAPPAARAQPFVGRASHLAALDQAFAAVRRGRTVAVLVHGRSGVGKSALVQRFLDETRARQPEAVVLASRCHEQETVAYKALDSVVDALSHHLRCLPGPEADVVLPRDVRSLTRLFPVLRRVEAVAEAPGLDREVPDPQELRRRGVAALRELLARLGDRRPLVLVIDDLQWGDRDSAELLVELLRPPDSPALLLVGCYRSEYAADSPCLVRLLQPGEAALAGPRRCEVAVEALTPDESRDLVLALLGRDDPAIRPLAERVARESGGHPYFVAELVQHLTEVGATADSLEAISGVDLDEVLWRRVARLPGDARLMLEVLAVAGRPLRQADACHAAGLGAEGFAALARLRVEHLVRGTGPGALDEVEPFHDRIRETVLKHLEPEAMRVRHLGLARELEAAKRADPETLAVHFAAAGMRDQAGRYTAAAATAAAAALAFDRAANLYRRALELRAGTLDEDRSLRTSLADALANAGRGPEAAQEYLAAAARAAPAAALGLRQRAGYQLLVSGHVDEGLEVLGAVLAAMGLRLPPSPRRALLSLLWRRALLRVRGLGFRERDAGRIPPEELDRVDIARAIAAGLTVVDWIRGTSFQAQSLLLALRAGEPLRVALALAWEAVPSACQGRPARRRTARLIAAAEALARRLDHPHALGMTMLARGASEFLEGRFRSGLETSDRAAAILRGRCTGVTWELDTAQLFGLWSLMYAGGLAELRRRTARLAQEAREPGDLYMESTVEVFPATFTRLAAGQVEEARARAAEAIRRWSQRGVHIQHLSYFLGSSQIDLYDGDGDGAWRRFREIEPGLRASQLLRIQLIQVAVLEHGGRAALAAAAAARDPRPMRRAAAGYARRLARLRLPWARGLALLIRAGAAAVGGDAAGAARLLIAAGTACDAFDMGLFSAAARRRRGDLLGGDEGRALVAQADAWMAGQEIRDPARMTACIAPGFTREG